MKGRSHIRIRPNAIDRKVYDVLLVPPVMVRWLSPSRQVIGLIAYVQLWHSGEQFWQVEDFSMNDGVPDLSRMPDNCFKHKDEAFGAAFEYFGRVR